MVSRDSWGLELMQYLCWIELGKRKEEELPRGLTGFWLLYSVDWMAVSFTETGNHGGGNMVGEGVQVSWDTLRL